MCIVLKVAHVHECRTGMIKTHVAYMIGKAVSFIKGRENERERERERDRESARERERERERESERESQRESESERETDIQRQTSTPTHRN